MGADDTNVVTLLPINKIIPNANKAEGLNDPEILEISKKEESKAMKADNEPAAGDIGTPNSFDKKDLVTNLHDLKTD